MMLIEVEPRLFHPEVIYVDLMDARRLRMLSMLSAPVGLVAFIAAFTLEMPPLAVAVLILAGILTDISAFYAYRLSASRTALLMMELRNAKNITKHSLFVEPEKDLNIGEIAEWARRNKVLMRVAYTTGQHFSFEDEDNKMLFRMKFV